MVGVCTKYFHESYGGMLQAYATTKALEKREIEYELVRYEKNLTLTQKVKSVPRLLNKVLLNDKYEMLLKEVGIRMHPEFAKNNAIRVSEFDKFKKAHYTKLSPVFKGYSDLCKGAERYSAVITGSDQLWSPAGLPTNFYNLMFVPNDVRKISFSSSFGVDEIPQYQKKRTAEYLRRIDFISVREMRGKEIVKELTGRDVPVTLDPTLLLSKEEWNVIAGDEKQFGEPYVFAYFLGANKSYREEAKKLAKEKQLKIVTLRHMDRYNESDENFGDFAPYDVDPARFLSILKGAEYVLTDSFHGVCFSVIYEKDFMVFNRYESSSPISKNSRIDSLCYNLGLEGRRYDGDIHRIDEKTDYDSINENLFNLKKSSNEYLDKALNGIV